MVENIFVVLLCLIPLLVLWLLIHYRIKARKMVKKWAQENNYQIIKLRQRHLFHGPFEFNYSPRRQKIFYVSIIDENGRAKNAFVKCGNFWKGLIADKVEIKWEKD